jgi:hypothetical protein
MARLNAASASAARRGSAFSPAGFSQAVFQYSRQPAWQPSKAAPSQRVSRCTQPSARRPM